MTDLDGGFVVDSRGSHALLDLPSHSQESLLDVAGVLCRGLQEWDADAVSKFLMLSAVVFIENRMTYLRHGVLNRPLICHIALVANQQLVDTLGRVAVDFLQPLLDIVERVHIGHIIDDADAMGTAVVGGSDGAESLLASRVPLSHVSAGSSKYRHQAYDLQLHGLAVQLNGPNFL